MESCDAESGAAALSMLDVGTATNTMSEGILPVLQSYFRGWPISVAYDSMKGRYAVAREAISAGRVVFRSIAYAHGIHDSFRKRVCDVCLQYNTAGRYEVTCGECHAVWYCSQACKDRAQGKTPTAPKTIEQTSALSLPPSITASDLLAIHPQPQLLLTHTLPPVVPSELHFLSCPLLRKLSSCKLEKGRIGVLRLLIRMYRKMQAEQSHSQPIAADPAIEPSSSSSNHKSIDSSLAAALAQLSLDEFQIDSAVDSEQIPSPIVPTFRDVSYLIGHPPQLPVSNSMNANLTTHQLDWIEIRQYLQKLFAASPSSSSSSVKSSNNSDAAATSQEDVDNMLHLLAQVESNGFGLYASKDTVSIPTNSGPSVTSDESTNSPEASSSSSSSSSLATSSGPCASNSSNPKYIGVLIHPCASYFNHSCSSNLRVVQQAHLLTFIARQDIPAGKELTIEYVDTNRPTHARRADLQDLYHFGCSCERCEAENGDNSTNASTSDSSALSSATAGKKKGSKDKVVKEKVSYATESSRERSKQKKGAPLKKKKIEVKRHPELYETDPGKE